MFISRWWQVNVFLTYMGDRYLELEDVDNVHLKLHPLVYTNKTWTPRKLLFRMRRDVILDVLSQVCCSNFGINLLHLRGFVCQVGLEFWREPAISRGALSPLSLSQAGWIVLVTLLKSRCVRSFSGILEVWRESTKSKDALSQVGQIFGGEGICHI